VEQNRWIAMGIQGNRRDVMGIEWDLMGLYVFIPSTVVEKVALFNKQWLIIAVDNYYQTIKFKYEYR
jgi:hypothetical protein